MDLTLLIVTNVVTGLASTVLGMWLTMIALNLEFVRKKITEGTAMTEPVSARPRKRRFGRTDLMLAIVITGFIITGANQISVGNKANNTAEENARLIKCLTGYSNDLADALDRRTDDNKKLADADSMRDDAVDDLLGKLLTEPPATRAQVREALIDLRATNGKKVQAKDGLDQGRKDKSYPEAPRDVCKT